MLKLRILLSIFLTLSIFSTQVYAKHIPSGAKTSRADEEFGREEALVSVKWPMSFLRYDLKDLLLTKGSAFKEISKIDLDPINRTFHFDALIEIPDSMMLSMEDKAGDKLDNEHSISLVLGFPAYVRGKDVEFTIKQFKLDDVDYSAGMHIVTNVVTGLLKNRSLINYFMDESKAPTDYSDEDLSKTIKELLEDGTIVMNDDRIRLKLNLKKFSDFKRYKELDDLQIWYIGPKKLKGTKEGVAFMLEAGIGNPSISYVKAVKDTHKIAAKDLEAVRKSAYEKFKYNKEVEQRITKLHANILEGTGIFNWNSREKRIHGEILSHLKTKARKMLSKDDLYFADEPERAHELFFEHAKEFLRVSLFDLKQRHVIDMENRNGGKKGTGTPFVNTRVSQNAVTQFTNFFRDFELIDKEPLFKELYVALAPHLPGVILKGRVNLELNALFEMGLEGEGIDFNNPDIRLDDKTYGKSVPFEVSLYTYMRDNGVLELDIKNATLGEGLGRVHLTPKTDKGYFLEEFVKLATANILKTYLISDPLAVKEDAGIEDPLVIKNNLIQKIENYKEVFSMIDPTRTETDILKIKELDLSGPFNTIPQEMVEENLVEFFNNILGIDRETGRIQVNLDPKIVTEHIMYAQNNIQVWNIEPIFDKLMDKTFIDLGIGYDTRSKKYLSEIYNRPEKQDSLDFVGTSGNKANEGPIDYSVKLNLEDFQTTVNTVLAASIKPQIDDALSELRQVEEGSVNILEDLTVKSTTDNQLSLSLTLNQVEKSKRWWGARAYNKLTNQQHKNFVVKNNYSSIDAKIKLHAVELDDYKKAILKKNPNEIFLGNTLLKLELESIGRTIKNGGIFSKVLNVMIGNVNLKNGIIGSNLKKLVLKIAGPKLNPVNKNNGSAVLGGFDLNSYVKVFTTKGDIFLQVNPRIAGPVWDLFLVKDQDYKGRKIGVGVDHKKKTFNADFKLVLNPSTVDKHELFLVMKRSIELANDIDKGKFRTTADFIKLYDELFYNSDVTKRSLLHRLKKVINTYDDLAILSAADKDRDNYSSTGAELMQVATASRLLSVVLEKAAQINQPRSIRSYGQSALKNSQSLEAKYVAPFKKMYAKRYLENNQKIIDASITDWTLYIIPDAIFAQKAFKYISK